MVRVRARGRMYGFVCVRVCGGEMRWGEGWGGSFPLKGNTTDCTDYVTVSSQMPTVVLTLVLPDQPRTAPDTNLLSLLLLSPPWL